MATPTLRHFEKLDDRCWEVASTGSATENQRPKLTIVTKRLVAEPAVAEFVKHRSVPALYHCKTSYFLTENAQMMASLKVSPGRSTVVGKSGLFGESGQCWHSMATPS